VTSDTEVFRSSAKAGHVGFEFSFHDEGEYTYHSDGDPNMVGKVRVVAPNQPLG